MKHHLVCATEIVRSNLENMRLPRWGGKSDKGKKMFDDTGSVVWFVSKDTCQVIACGQIKRYIPMRHQDIKTNSVIGWEGEVEWDKWQIEFEDLYFVEHAHIQFHKELQEFRQNAYRKHACKFTCMNLTEEFNNIKRYTLAREY